jgi:hypothetical protein
MSRNFSSEVLAMARRFDDPSKPKMRTFTLIQKRRTDADTILARLLALAVLEPMLALTSI